MDWTNPERRKAALAELRVDYAAGEKRLRELDAQRKEVVATLARIAGAIEVLEGMVAEQEKQ